MNNLGKTPKASSISGFSLVELSTVVLFIGLLVSFLVYGQGLLKNASIRRTINEFEEYSQQIMLFRNQFIAYPGDIANASTFWGTQCDPTPSNCNGNGDGYIDFSTTNLLDNESWRAWQHLKLAGINNNNMNGTGTAATSLINFNVPQSSLGYNLGLELRTYTTTKQKYTSLDLYYIASGVKKGISCVDAALIDAKVDDGLPLRGNLIVSNTSPSTNCYSTTSSPYKYITTNTNTDGALQWIVVPGIFHPNYE